MKGPDFICIGMPKAGTGWLYDQLDAHPDFWMPPVKELVYLNQSHPALAFVSDAGDAVRPRKERLARQRGTSPQTKSATGERRVHRDPLTEKDLAFLNYASTGRGTPMDLEFYAGLFWFSGERLSGDITPPYCNIGSHTVRRVAQRFPRAKILLLVRDPVARVWSRICMSHAGKGFDTDLLNDAAAFRSYIEHNRHKLGGPSATQTWQRWQRHAPDMQRRFFFFDDLASQPESVRDDILIFLGGAPAGGVIAPDYNRKAKAKLEMTPLAREVLVDRFSDELLASAEIFGGPARSWPAVYGL